MKKAILLCAAALLIIVILFMVVFVSFFGSSFGGGANGEGTWSGYEITSPFGERVHPITGEVKNHHGVDLAIDENTALPSFMDGTVTETGYDEGGYGYYIVVRDKDGNETLYGHLNSIAVSKGQEVKRGDIIGLTGSTGASTGPHLHLEYKDANGNLHDPTQVLKSF